MADPTDTVMGRPSKFDPKFVTQAAKLCELGATDMEVADFLEVDVRTLYRWKHEHEDFCQALKAGKEAADERVERSLYAKATGYTAKEEQAIRIRKGQYEEEVEVVEVDRHVPADTTAAIFWLKNRRSQAWRDRQDHTVGNPDGSPLATERSPREIAMGILAAVRAAQGEDEGA
jgi:hypothetical protein